MKIASIKLNKHNQIVLPKAARTVLNVKPGQRVQVLVDGQTVHLLPEPEDWSESIYGLGAEVWALLGGGERFLAEERAAWNG